MQVYGFVFFVLASTVVEVVSNASVVAYKKDVMDEDPGTEVVGHEYEVQYICLDAFFEIMVGALSSLLLGYEYSKNAIRFYWLALAIPYLYQSFRGILYVTSYCELDVEFVTVPNGKSIEDINNDSTISAGEKYFMLFQKIFTPSRMQIAADVLSLMLSAYMNLWNESAWFAASMIPNTAFEIYYLVEPKYSMPELFFRL